MGLTLIAAIISAAALALGRDFFIPIALALCFHALLRPAVRALERLRFPAWLGASVVMLGTLVVLFFAGVLFSSTVKTFMAQAPSSIAKAREKLSSMGTPIRKLTDAAAGRDSMPAQDSTRAQDSSSAPDSTPRQGQGRRAQAPPPPSASAASSGGSGPSLIAAILGQGASFVALVVEVLVLLYLLLAAGNRVFRKLIRSMQAPDDKRTASDVLHETESIVSRYLVITALINVGQGLAVGLAMWAIGMPNPLMWGLLTFALEFIPFLGGAINVVLLLITAFTTFDSLGQILLAPGLYLLITTLQNNVVSPFAYGGRLKLNPVAIMICVLFWFFIWGIPGAFLAIPIAAMMKVLGDQIPRLAPLAELLGD